MNRLILKKMALSTLLLSSIATPVFADAGGAPGQVQTPAVTLTAATASEQGNTLITSPFPDLLSLAERYAPDTVQDWTDTLSRYRAASGIAVRIFNLDAFIQDPVIAGSDEITGPAGETATPVNLTAVLPSLAGSATEANPYAAVELRIITPVNAADGTLSDSIAGIAVSQAADLTRLAVPDSLTSAGLSGIAVNTAAAPALLPLPGAHAFIQVQTELLEAVESGDATAVKQALAGLLIQYKELTSKLEEAK